MTTPSVPPIALAGEPHDLSTSAGGRAYVSEFFSTRLRRHDFGSYISERLAADFACVLAKYLSEHFAAPSPSASSVPVAKMDYMHDDDMGRRGFVTGWNAAIDAVSLLQANGATK